VSQGIPGVNVVGYHDRALGLGAEARRVSAAFEAAHMTVRRVNAQMSGSPVMVQNDAGGSMGLFDASIFVVAGDQIFNELLKLGYSNFVSHYRIGFWYWELDRLTPTMQRALIHVDELWAGSRWIEEVFRAETSKPVFRVPTTKPQTVANPKSRMELGIPEDKIVFLVTFDYFSVFQRKNPMAAIEAYKAAFPTVGDQMMLVKTQNGDVMHEDAKLIEALGSGRPDIIFMDRHVDDHTQASLLARSDVLVSLHRAEGLGLHLLEASAYGVPTIFTNYSAPSEFLNVNNAFPIDYRPCNVVGGKGVYPDGYTWADPDIEHAAHCMRLAAEDEVLRRSLGVAARETVESLPTLTSMGATLAARIESVR